MKSYSMKFTLANLLLMYCSGRTERTDDQYIQREYYFDVHPPMAKMLFAFVGWFVGFDGHFQFENIGDSYTDNNVPYVALRSLPAFLGALTVSVVFCIMRDSGYRLVACIVSSAMILFGIPHL